MCLSNKLTESSFVRKQLKLKVKYHFSNFGINTWTIFLSNLAFFNKCFVLAARLHLTMPLATMTPKRPSIGGRPMLYNIQVHLLMRPGVQVSTLKNCPFGETCFKWCCVTKAFQAQVAFPTKETELGHKKNMHKAINHWCNKNTHLRTTQKDMAQNADAQRETNKKQKQTYETTTTTNNNAWQTTTNNN